MPYKRNPTVPEIMKNILDSPPVTRRLEHTGAERA